MVTLNFSKREPVNKKMTQEKWTFFSVLLVHSEHMSRCVQDMKGKKTSHQSHDALYSC